MTKSLRTEFNKLTNILTEDKFQNTPDGFLGFLVSSTGELEASENVKLGGHLGNIFAVAANYEGLKELQANPKVYAIEWSSPGGF